MELVMILPIFGIVLFGLFEFSLLFAARGRVVEASRAGARMACLAGATREAVEEAALGTLDHSLRQTAQVRVDLGEATGDVARVAVVVPMTEAAPDLLWPVGFGLDGRTLYAETRMAKE